MLVYSFQGRQSAEFVLIFAPSRDAFGTADFIDPFQKSFVAHFGIFGGCFNDAAFLSCYLNIHYYLNMTLIRQ
jgi:hypothetical protein